MAIVVEECGGTYGLVTQEEVLDEIVGDIQDESDREEPAIHAVDAQATVFDAHLPIDDVNEELRLELPPGDYDTLGGFVYDLFGRPPLDGERVTYNGIDFIVEEREGPRLLKIRIVRHPPGEAAPGEG